MVVMRASQQRDQLRGEARRSGLGPVGLTPRRSSSARTAANCAAQHLEVEPFLRAVVIVAGGDVGAGALGDVADRGAVEPVLREELGRGGEQALGRGADDGGRGMNGRLKHVFD